MMKLLIAFMLVSTVCYADAGKDFVRGPGDHIDYASPAAFSDAGDKTLAGWLNLDDLSDEPSVFTFNLVAGSGNAGYSLFIRTTAEMRYVKYAGDTVLCDTTTMSVPTDQWTWAAVSVDQDVNCRYQNDDSFQSIVNTDAEVDCTDAACTGRTMRDIRDDNQGDGSASHIQLYGEALTDVGMHEIRWNPEMLVGAGDRIAYWPLWETSGAQIDLEPNKLNGTISGADSIQDGPPVFFGGGLPL